MSVQPGSQELNPSPESIAPNGGIVLEVPTPRIIKSMPGGHKIISDTVLEAIPQSGKKDLGAGSLPLTEVPEAKIVYGGQDCYGAATFEGGRIQGVVVAADGASFGSKKDSAIAARVTVATILQKANAIAANPNLSRTDIQSQLETSFEEADKNIKKAVSDGPTTAVAALIYEEPIRGASQIFLQFSSIGDSQLTLLGTNPDQTVYLRKLVAPSDVIEEYLKLEGFNYDTVTSLSEIEQARQNVIEKYKATDPRVEQAATTGIRSYLGVSQGNSYEAISMRINLSEELFAKGIQNLTLVASSDNIGEKMDENKLKAAYNFGRSTNKEFLTKLNNLLGASDADDGGAAVMRIGRQGN